MPTDVLFDFDKAAIRPAAQPALHELAALLARARGAVAVTGHTDDVGEPAWFMLTWTGLSIDSSLSLKETENANTMVMRVLKSVP